MQNTHQNTLGLTLAISVPSSADEYDQLAGRVGACVEDAVSESTYRNYLPSWKRVFFSRLAEQTGIERVVEKDEDGKVTSTEKETTYFKRVQAETGKTADDYAALAQECADETPFDLTPKSRSTKIAKSFLEAADNILRAIENGQSTAETVANNLQGTNPGLVVVIDEDGVLDRDSLARGIRTNNERVAREQNAGLLG